METARDRIHPTASDLLGQEALTQRLLRVTGRALLGIYFILPGIMKVVGFEDTSAYMAAHHVPLIPVALILTIILQIGGGVLLVAGYKTAPIAFLLAGLTLVISVFMHNFWVYEEGIEQAHELQNFVKNLGIMAGLMYVAGTAKTSG